MSSSSTLFSYLGIIICILMLHLLGHANGWDLFYFHLHSTISFCSLFIFKVEQHLIWPFSLSCQTFFTHRSCKSQCSACHAIYCIKQTQNMWWS
jgi:hypothetical protein